MTLEEFARGADQAMAQWSLNAEAKAIWVVVALVVVCFVVGAIVEAKKADQ